MRAAIDVRLADGQATVAMFVSHEAARLRPVITSALMSPFTYA